MGKGGKVQHWKHGWIPLDAFARRVIEERQKKKIEADADRQKRYLDHLNGNADADAARRKRYLDHLNRDADKRVAMQKRYAAAQNRKLRRNSPG